MDLIRQVIVLDATNLEEESSFWAAVVGGNVANDDTWHSVVNAMGHWLIGGQLSENQVPPSWPVKDQQHHAHLDLDVEDFRSAHDEVMALGA